MLSAERPGAGLGHRRRRPCGADRGERGAETRLVRVLRAADRAGAGADPRPVGADRAADRARPCGRDPRRHAAGAADADPDHRAAQPARGGSAPAISAIASTSAPPTSWRNWPTSSTAWPASLQETYSGLEAKVEERTRDLAQSINELKVLEEVGRAVASSLDLNAVLPTVAARALEITHADAVLIYGYDAARHQFNLDRGDRHRQARRRRASRDRRGRQRARRGRHQGRADRDPRSRRRRRPSAARRRGRAPAFIRCWWCRWSTRQGVLGSLVVLRARRRRILAESDRPDAHLRAPIGAGDAQCAAVHRSRPEGPRTGVRAFHRAAAGRQAAGADRSAPELEQVAGGAGREAARARSSASAGSNASSRRRWRN